MRKTRVSAGAFLVLALLSCFLATGAQAQQITSGPVILFLEQDQLLTNSVAGKQILEMENVERTALISEGQALDKAFEAEELELTQLRATAPAERFRELADAFDAKVIATRQAQEEKATTLTQNADQRRRAFYQNVVPILAKILDETGAAAVLDQRSVLISSQNMNITEEVIRRLDALSVEGQSDDLTTPPAGVDDN